jgi:hypothetical protein
MRTPVLIGAAALATAVCGGSLLGSLNGQHASQLLRFPYVDAVPVELALVVTVLAVASLASTTVLYRQVWEGAPQRLLDGLLLLLALVGTLASAWSAVYMTAIENAIPVFDWLFFAVPVGLACLVLPSAASRDRCLATGLLMATPIAAMHALGWANYGDSARSGILATLTLGGFGLLIGLVPALVRR